jgi:hypothetical protein
MKSETKYTQKSLIMLNPYLGNQVVSNEDIKPLLIWLANNLIQQVFSRGEIGFVMVTQKM